MKEDADYVIDKALATGLLDSNGNLNFHMHGTREEIITGILTTAKAWGQLMTCDQAERIADRAIRKARWPIGNNTPHRRQALSITIKSLSCRLRPDSEKFAAPVVSWVWNDRQRYPVGR